jgi:hypothetical protein
MLYSSSLGSTAVAVGMRVAVTVAVVVPVAVVRMVRTAVGSITAAFAAAFSAVAVVCCYTPEAVAAPGAFLALFGAVLCATAATALCELPCVFFPLAALPVSTLSDATARVVFPAEVTHDYACPV